MHYSTSFRPQPHRYIYLGANNNLAQRPDSASERDFRASVGFSGHGSLGVLRRQGEQRNSKKDELCSDDTPVWVEYKYLDQSGITKTTRITVAETLPPSYLVESFNPSQRLEFLSELAIREKFRRSLEREDVSTQGRKRVARTLTSRGRRNIRDGVAILESKYGTRKLGFYTLTCPYADSADIQIFNDNYPEILRRYFQELKREYERQGLCFSYVGVYEIQPSRFERTGDECLHFHYVSPACDVSGRFILHHSRIRDIYGRIVASVCGKNPGVLPRVDSQLVRKSGSGYLAKYFSKGVSPDATGERDGAVAALSSWFSLSRNLLTAIRKSRTELPGHIADDLFRRSARGEKSQYASYLRPIYRFYEGREFHVGCVFQLEESYMSVIREIVFPQICNLV